VTETFFPISTLPAPYDIVWCRFPEHVDLGEPGPKPRPAIVLNVAADAEAGESEVQLVYGTGKLKFAKRPRDFFVTNVAEMDACGLSKATRFDLDNIAWIPWEVHWFDILPGYASPVIGHLSHHATKLLQMEMGRRQAQTLREADCE
jgi:hypothetical protein